MQKQIWSEVGLNLMVRGIWSAFFVVTGVFIHDIHESVTALVLLVGGTLLLLGLALLFEYHRAQRRLRRCLH